MAGNPVVVAKYSDHVTASMAKQALDDAGIPAFILGTNIAELYPAMEFAKIEIQVPAERFDEAVEVIENFEASLNQDQADDNSDEPIDE
ncbi:MAG: hypothetical protein A2Y07_00870 [Planctomycetes bacterium GWF2_50_10]|nr:MAG: hypothetical protein A2Y07_00870 [Planctomycetes bacterium GWF2_50_10]